MFTLCALFEDKGRDDKHSIVMYFALIGVFVFGILKGAVGA